MLGPEYGLGLCGCCLVLRLAAEVVLQALHGAGPCVLKLQGSYCQQLMQGSHMLICKGPLRIQIVLSSSGKFHSKDVALHLQRSFRAIPWTQGRSVIRKTICECAIAGHWYGSIHSPVSGGAPILWSVLCISCPEADAYCEHCSGCTWNRWI